MAPQVEGDKMHMGTKRGHTYEKYNLILLKGTRGGSAYKALRQDFLREIQIVS